MWLFHSIPIGQHWFGQLGTLREGEELSVMKVSLISVALGGQEDSRWWKTQEFRIWWNKFWRKRHVRKSLGRRGKGTVTFNLGRALFSAEVRMF